MNPVNPKRTSDESEGECEATLELSLAFFLATRWMSG